MSEARIVDVAVGVLLRGNGEFLLAQRPQGKPYAGYWEFPGGKLERGESVADALRRELHEELGLDIGAVCPWVVRQHVYPHAHVRLHFCRVYDWRGDAHGREGQAFGFFTLDRLPDGPLLEGALPVMPWLALPELCWLRDSHRPAGAPAGALALERAAVGTTAEWWVETSSSGAARSRTSQPRRAAAEAAVAAGADFLIVEEQDVVAILGASPVPVFVLGSSGVSLAELRARGAHGAARRA